VSWKNSFVFSHSILPLADWQQLPRGVIALKPPINLLSPYTASPYPSSYPSTLFQSQILVRTPLARGRHCDSKFGQELSAMIVTLLLRFPMEIYTVSNRLPRFKKTYYGASRIDMKRAALPAPRNKPPSSISNNTRRTSSAATTKSCFASCSNFVPLGPLMNAVSGQSNTAEISCLCLLYLVWILDHVLSLSLDKASPEL